MELVHLYISSGHNFFGRHGQIPDDFPMTEVERVQCVAGHGIRGDRFFDHRDQYKGQITFFAEEVYVELCAALNVHDRPASGLRRNVITRGIDLSSFVGQDWETQGIRFRGVEECRPCYWMDRAFGQGAEKFLCGRGGLRARILTNGELHSGPASFSSTQSDLPLAQPA